MNLEIDHIENKNNIDKILREYSDVSYDYQQLPHGDFILNKQIIFERKTIIDFVQSIIDGRLFRQAYKGIDRNLSCVLILEGDVIVNILQLKLKNTKIHMIDF